MKTLRILVVYVLLITLGGCISATQWTEDDWTRLEDAMAANGNLSEEEKAAIRAEIEAGTMSQEEIDNYKALLAEQIKEGLEASKDYVPLPDDLKGPLYGIAVTLVALWGKKKGGQVIKKIKDSPPGKIMS